MRWARLRERLRRRNSSRTESAQGVWHQQQRHTGAGELKMGAEVDTKIDVLLAI
jgi:hypothetical protein